MTTPAAGLPTGTVTYLFSDIERSTRLLQQLGEAYAELLERHAEIVRDAVSEHGGVEVSTEGDSFFVVFDLATEAAECAVALTRRLQDEPWPPRAEVRVRIGLHTGEGRLRPGGYVGIDVHRAARIGDCGHGGQIIVSATTRALIMHALPSGTSLFDLGRHQLKDLAFPEHLYQLTISGLPGDFPAIRTRLVPMGNLPVRETTFVGRSSETDATAAAISEHRLVTLVGAAGVGKTSLAIHAASRLSERFPDGEWLVEIARLTEESQIASAVARALKIIEPSVDPMPDALAGRLGYANVLLILDGCEHLIGAVAAFAEGMMVAAPGVHLLVTSREPLALRAEHVVRLDPLATPGPYDRGAAGIMPYDAVALFVDRARQVQAGFRVDDENAQVVAEITRRLDGIPLAIELAAAQMKMLAVGQIAERLQRDTTDLVSHRRDALPHHRTLWATLDWSYESLTPIERSLLATLSVFSGGFTLDAVEELCCRHEPDRVAVIDVLGRLVDTSLVLVGDTDPVRYRLLEPVAQYARGRLAKLDDAAEIHRAHADYYLELAEEGAAGLLGRDQLGWLRRLDAERYNLGAALDWMHGIGDATGVVRMAAALRMRWMIRREVAEGTRWLRAALAERGDAPPEIVIQALTGAALLAIRRLDIANASEWLEEAHTLATRIADPRVEAAQVAGLAILTWFRDDDDSEADALAARALTMQPDWWTRAWMLAHRGTLARVRGDHEAATTYLDAAHDIVQDRGGGFDLGWSFLRLGALAKDLGQYALATRHLQEGRVLLAEAGDTIGLAHADAGLGALAWLRGEHEQALALYESVLKGFGRAEEIGDNLFELRTMLQGRVSSDQLRQIASWNQERSRLGLAGVRAALAEHLLHLGKTAFRRSELDRARNALSASLELCAGAADYRGACVSIIALARVYLAAGDAERSITLLSCAASTAVTDGFAPWPPDDEPDFDRHVEEARQSLPSGIYERAWARGAKMTLDDALVLASVKAS